MCGISLVLSGDPLVVSPSAAAAAPTEIHHSGEGKGVSVDELKEALRRRGPDNLGCLRRRLCADGTVLGSDGCNGGGEGKASAGDGSVAELFFIGATLHLRGAEPVAQPLVSPSGSVLVYNGEIYGGIEVADDENDTQALFSSLESCCSCDCHALGRDKSCSCCASGDKSVPQIQTSELC